MKNSIGTSESSIKKFFEGRPAAFELFKALRRMIEKTGSPTIEVTNTQISFGEKYKYAWIWLPQTWIKKRPENSVTLTICTGKRIKSDRIEESVQPKKGYWTHHIIIESKKDIDKEIAALIRESYTFYLHRLEHKRSQKKKRIGISIVIF